MMEGQGPEPGPDHSEARVSVPLRSGRIERG
jgi:hypothetical protein